MSDDMKNMTAVEGSKLSSSDVQQISLSIDTLINLPNSELSDSTVDNLISTIDNVQTNTDVKELQDEQASDELRESAVAIIRAVARQNDNNVLKTEESIGLNEFLSKTFIIKYYLLSAKRNNSRRFSGGIALHETKPITKVLLVLIFSGSH